MLLKGCQSTPSERRAKVNVNKLQRNCTASAMKLTVGGGNAALRGQRKVTRPGTKRPATGKRILLPAGRPDYEAADPCDSSNDSGLGYEPPGSARQPARLWSDVGMLAKRKKLEIKMESDDANDNFTFEETINQAKRGPSETQMLLPMLTRVSAPRPAARRPALTAVQRRVGPTMLAAQLLGNGGAARPVKPHLQIISQPEQQHRARYQTEGSRGAVKDRTGNGFPMVKLVGYEGPAVLQVFIGSDLGRVVPHMFYQACRVSGKNSTACSEKNVDGTVVIEVEFERSKDYVVTCDCVGILKERNVDVEHRFPDQSGPRNKKKSTRCRMVFRTVITHPNGTEETLEISSQPIVCTQPPGIPEICKKSLTSCVCTGGQELFILGKNFLKDTRVVFSSCETQPSWEVSVQPDKEYLQQSHLVCMVPPYCDENITEPVGVRLSVTSSGKTSESHLFRYLPQHQVGNNEETLQCVTKVQSGSKQLSAEQKGLIAASTVMSPIIRPMNASYLLVQPAQGGGKESVFLWKPATGLKDGRFKKKLVSTSSILTPPPLQPLTSSTSSPVSACVIPISTKQLTANQLLATVEEGSRIATASVTCMSQVIQCTSPVTPLVEPSEPVPCTTAPDHFAPVTMPMATGADLSSTQSPSMATLRRFVSTENDEWALPSLNVEKFLSGLEHKESKLEEANQLLSANTSAVHLSPSMNVSDGIKFESSPTINLLPSMLLHQAELHIDTMKHKDENSSPHTSPVLTNVSLPFSHGIAPTILCNSLASSQISAVQSARLDEMVSSAMTVSTENTERLEALVNSAAECHLSPTVSTNGYDIMPVNHFSEEMLKKDALSLNTALSIENQDVMMNVLPCSQLTENIFTAESQTSPCTLPINVTDSMSPKLDVAQSTFSPEEFHSTPLPAIYDSNMIPTDTAHLADLLLPAVSQAVTERVANLCNSVPSIEPSCENVNNMFSGRSEASFIAEASTLNEPCCLLPPGPDFSVPAGGAACTTTEMHCTTTEMHCTTSNLILSLKEKAEDVMAPQVKMSPVATPATGQVQKREEGMVPRELTQMSENDLLSYINPSCFDTV